MVLLAVCVIDYLRSYLLCIFFFFFQAEDGIRDWSVTGVQTCALPISPAIGEHVGIENVGDAHPRPVMKGGAEHPISQLEAGGMAGSYRLQPASARLRRSEERRVGKECRSGWATAR